MLSIVIFINRFFLLETQCLASNDKPFLSEIWRCTFFQKVIQIKSNYPILTDTLQYLCTEWREKIEILFLYKMMTGKRLSLIRSRSIQPLLRCNNCEI